MTRSDSVELVIDLPGDGREAASRIAQALEDNPEPGPTTPRLMGRISFPTVTVWRARGRAVRSPFARFDGSVQQLAGGAVLAGRVSVPERASFVVTVVTALTVVFFLVAIAALLAAGTLASLVALMAFVLTGASYLYITRRVVRANSAVEAELLIRELRELVAESQRGDS